MSPILPTILFASAAAAQITTSVWLPSSPYSPDDTNFQASVIAAEGDHVTMAISLNVEDSYAGESTIETVTFHGSTSFENIVTYSDSEYGYEGEATVSYGCSKEADRPVCAFSSNGPAVWSEYCADFSDYRTAYTTTETYTFDSPSSVVEQVQTYDNSDLIPDFCLTGSLLPESYAVMSMSMKGTKFETYPITITAGEDKLSATAGATPTNSRASATTTPTGSVTPTVTPSGSNSTVPSSSPTAPNAPAEQTGAAAPMLTLAPALAGLGALVAALL
jgi:hypothetical protein